VIILYLSWLLMVIVSNNIIFVVIVTNDVVMFIANIILYLLGYMIITV
jgi:hypothetical protein